MTERNEQNVATGVAFFEMLENRGVLRGATPDVNRIAALAPVDLLDIANEAVDITSASDAPQDSGVFTHTGTMSLGGWPFPCASVECRSRNVRGLAQFAALYSDCVYVPNVVMDYSSHPSRWTEDEESFKALFADDLTILGAIRPLVEAGRIVPITPPASRCAWCFAARDAKPQEVQAVEATKQMLTERLFEATRIELYQGFDGYRLSYSGNQEDFDHSYSRPLPPWAIKIITNRTTIDARIRRGERVPASKTLRRQLRFHEHLAQEVLRDVMFELAIAQVLGTSFLADRPMQISALERLTGGAKQADRNTIIREHLTTILPFVGELAASDLMTLREREAEAFILFRQALNTAIDEAGVAAPEFTSSHAKQLYADVIEPGLARLELKIMEGKKGLRSVVGTTLGSWGAALTFGVLTGILPFDLSGVAKALGIASAQKATESVLGSRDTHKRVRSEDLYFLWRVRQLAK